MQLKVLCSWFDREHNACSYSSSMEESLEKKNQENRKLRKENRKSRKKTEKNKNLGVLHLLTLDEEAEMGEAWTCLVLKTFLFF